ncbi:hypothetical protein SteCoe_19504 [Stentor coeruleus]|uniref:Uncharacterized protein n=1 Tax=Stentor coeruleus TaxID=5963 RepID=A0A1R2BUG9_9CILI|nr:hypothetical protein SteCoe_19504 [Stentor coeruleus]
MLSIFLIPLFFIGQKVTKNRFSAWCKKMLGKYKFSYFVRFAIETYLDLGLLSLIEIKSKHINSPEGWLNIIVAWSMLCAVFLMPLIILIFSWQSYKSNIYVENENFMKKWGSLYYEFKNNKGFWSSQYYTLYMIRRLVYMMVLILMNDNLYLQFSIHLLFTILQLMYVFYFTPFKEKDVLLSLVFGEISTLLVIILSFLFIAETSKSTRRLTESAIVIIVITSLGCDMLISLVMIVKEAKETIEKIKEKYFKRKIMPKDVDDEKCMNIKVNSFMNSPHSSFRIIEVASMDNE